MFETKRKKLYKVEYKVNGWDRETIVEAKDEFQALRRFKRETHCCYRPDYSIISIKEYVEDEE